MPEHTIEVDNLHLWRGDRHVLRGVSFRVVRGGCLEVCGANGAGKTTLLRALCGLVYPEQGRILWNGENVRHDLPAFHEALVYLGHEPPLKSDLTARENLHYWIGVRRQLGEAELAAALTRVGAPDWCDRLVRTLSAGQRRRVALAAVALLPLPLWLLDEPTTNLDTEGRELVGDLVREQLERGGMVVAAVHQGLPQSVRNVTRLELAA